MIWFLSLFTREYEQRHALLIIFLASSFWGVLWVPMRHIEAMGLSGLWVVVLFHFLPAVAIILFSLGTLEADGVFIIAGFVTAIASVLFITVFYWGVIMAVLRMMGHAA